MAKRMIFVGLESEMTNDGLLEFLEGTPCGTVGRVLEEFYDKEGQRIDAIIQVRAELGLIDRINFNLQYPDDGDTWGTYICR